jgi:hypothetical protein
MSRPFTFTAPESRDVHPWLFGQIRRAQFMGFPADHILKTFPRALTTMYKQGVIHRDVPKKELDDSVANIFRTINDTPAEPAPLSYDPTLGWSKAVRTPKGPIDPDLVERALTSSPVSNIAVIPDSVGHWHQLFDPNDLLCVGKSFDDYKVISAAELPAHESYQFIVPNPLRKRAGRTQTGNLTGHCRDVVGPRRYIVMESDHGTSFDQQVAILFWVAEKTETPLRLVVRSGGKSLHGWFDTAGASETDIFNWVRLVIRVGFDPRLILPEQYSRYPGGLRPDKNARQEILFTNIS